MTTRQELGGDALAPPLDSGCSDVAGFDVLSSVESSAYHQRFSESATGTATITPAMHRQLADMHSNEAAEGVRRFRGSLKELSTQAEFAVERALSDMLPSTFERPVYEVELDVEGDRRQVYGRATVVSWLALERLTSNEQVIDFLRWNHDTIDGLRRDPEIKDQLWGLKEDFRQHVVIAVENNSLPRCGTVSVAYAKAPKVPIKIVDVFDTAARGCDGYYRAGSAALGAYLFARSYDAGKRQGLAWHEMTHATLGGIPAHPWFGESRAEQITQILQYGEPEVLDPALRGTSNVYFHERKLDDVLMSKGVFPISRKLGNTVHLFEGRDNYAMDRLHDQLDAAWGYRGGEYHFLDFVTANVSEHQQALEQKGYLSTTAQALACKGIYERLLENPGRNAVAVLALS